MREKRCSVFQTLFEQKQINKLYRCLVFGQFDQNIKLIKGHMIKDESSKIHSKFKCIEDGIINSETHIISAKNHESYSELEIKPVTGYTNQIRCHLASKGHPIIGDKKYFFDETVYLNWYENNTHDKRLILDKQALHCQELAFYHPLLNMDLIIKSISNIFEKKRNIIDNHFT